MKVSFTTLLTSVLMTSAGKIMSALGVGFVTYQGLSGIQQKFMSEIASSMSSLPAASIQIIMMAGVGIALNWTFGAITTIVTFKSVTYLSTVLQGK